MNKETNFLEIKLSLNYKETNMCMNYGTKKVIQTKKHI